MATISDEQSGKCRHFLHASHYSLMEAESPYLSKAQYKAALQAIEDFWEAQRTTLKGLIDTAVGATISNELAKKIGKFWLNEKWGIE